MELVRYGIISSAWIADKEVAAIRRSKYAKIVAVSSRSDEKLKDFVKRNDIDESKVKCFTSYEELIQYGDVEVVYIPIPTTLRFPIVKLAAEAGKHIIVEKPFCSSDEVKEIIEICQRNKVCIMDNTMFLHHLRMEEIECEFLSDDEGKPFNRKKLKRIQSIFNYTNRFVDGIRYNPKLEPDGCLGDLGWYCIQGILWGFNELPIDVIGTEERHEKTGAMINCQVMMRFKNNRYATFSCSFDETTYQELNLVFSDDMILKIPEFVVPLQSDIAVFVNPTANEEMKIPYSEVTNYSYQGKNGMFQKKDCEPCYQVVKLIDNFSKDVRMVNKEGKFGYERIQRSYECMKVIEAIKKSIDEKSFVVVVV